MAEHRAQPAGRAPDPGQAASPQEFVAHLRVLRVWAGNPSFEQLARSSGVPRSTLADALSRHRDRLPALDVVRRFVRACGVTGVDALSWEERWRQLQAARVAAPVAAAAARTGRPVPRQLPAEVSGFVGRGEAIAELDAMCGLDDDAGPVVISAVAGTAGVGKTALAVHWAHRAAGQFPDGQLYVNLRGYHPGPPMRPIEALAHFLQALGIANEQIPVETHQAAGLYRSLLAGRRMLVLLDNAADPDQVRPLLPGSGCLVLVTSRDQLSGLVARDGARRLTLDRLPEPEAVCLLRGLLGERVDREPAAASALVDRCVGLPLALRIAAAQLADHPQLRLAGYLDQLTGEDRLAALEVDGDPHTAVRAAFDLSYDRLAPDTRRLFRLLGLPAGPDVTAESAAALAGTTTRQAARWLDRLAGAHLLERHGADRFALHDLLRAYAAARVIDDPAADRDAAAGRLYRYYLAGTDAAGRLLYPQTLRLPPDPGEDGAAGTVTFPDQKQALAWLESERQNLLATITHTAAHGPPAVAWRLADNLRGYFWLRMYTVDWLAAASAGLAAAEADRQLAARAAGELSLVTLRRRQDEYEHAVEHAGRALRLAARAGWPEGEAAALSNLGAIHQRTGQLEQAAEHHARALAINQRAGLIGGQAGSLYNLGLLYYDLGQLSRAAEHTAAALAIVRQIGTHSGHATALALLGEIDRALGRLAEAQDSHRQSLAMARDAGDRGQEAIGLLSLAAVNCDAGRHAEALELARSAVEQARDIGARQIEAAALNGLATVHHHLGDHQQAVDGYRQALDLARQASLPFADVDARIGLADGYRGQREYGSASSHAERARDLARGAGYRMLEGNALTAIGEIRLAQQQLEPARAVAYDALAIHRETGHRLGEARTHRLLGDVTVHSGDVAAARRHWRAALDLFDEIGTREADRTRTLLAGR
jgi:tetratricopeptide (TPR) repeat protein